MITSITPNKFLAVPWLETSLIMKARPVIEFSISKPNVIIGPNGSGKSALLTALSMLTLTYYEDTSTFESHYINMSDSDVFWRKNDDGKDWWERSRLSYLSGLSYSGDIVPTLYYRPNRMPGNERSVAHAMMTGYFDQAREYARMTEYKSSGQKSQAIQELMFRVLRGEQQLEFTSRLGDPDKLTEIDARYYSGDIDSKTNLFKTFYLNRKTDSQTVILDEPEQSLDLEAEIALWQALKQPHSKTQVICATHSLYPILHPQHFNVIETVPGYADRIRQLIA